MSAARRSAVVLAGVALLAGAAPVRAATITRDGSGTLVVTAAPGEQNRVVLGASTTDAEGVIAVSDRTPLAVATEGCDQPGQLVNCRVDAGGVRIDLGDGADGLSVNFDLPVTVAVAAAGGAGDDTLTGGAERDTLDGGDGNDTVDGRGGSDVILGGTGDDAVLGDHFEDPAPDVVDGGPGTDTFADDWTSRAADLQPDATLTLAGGADDGRPGEGDDVRHVERVIVNEGGSLQGTDAPEHLEAFQTVRAIRLDGAGGDDELKGGGGADVIDGGPGADLIDAGFGDDTVVAGPGRDTVFADRRGGDCGPLWCTSPYGNDDVDVRDGEVDSVDCGAGQDTVHADPLDVVAANCETVLRDAAPPPGAGGAGGSSAAPGSGAPGPGAGTPGPVASCRVPRVVGRRVAVARARLRAAHCRVAVRGHGQHVARQSIRAGRRVPRTTVVRLTLRR